MSLLAAHLTVYSENATPNLALKQIYNETGVSSEIRIKISNSSILSIDDFANLGESSAELLVGIVSILGGVESLGKGSAATVAKTTVVSAWRRARTNMLNNESLRMRLLEDPLNVPEMTYSTYDDFRSAFEAAHLDVELVTVPGAS